MEKRALVLALALTVPLALYGIPYAYAATTGDTATVISGNGNAASNGAGLPFAPIFTNSNGICTVTYDVFEDGAQTFSVRFSANGVPAGNTQYTAAGGNSHTDTVAASEVDLTIYAGSSSTVYYAYSAICHSTLAVAGIGVPQFGSLYVAIALGAVVYFLLAKRLAPVKTGIPAAS
jgi:hypothetical protein